MKRALVALLLLFALAQSACAAIKETCVCSYQRQDGSWSEEYRLSVTFVTGDELNQATNTVDYKSYARCAVIWFAQGECAVVNLGENIIPYLGAGTIFTRGDLIRLENDPFLRKLTGDDKSGRHWIILLPSF